MEDERTYLDKEKINVDIKKWPIKPIVSCSLVNSSHWRNDTKNRLYYRGLCTNRFKIIGNKASMNLCYIFCYNKIYPRN